MKKIFVSAIPFIFIITIVIIVLTAMVWKVNSAKHYTLSNLTYERVEPEKEWATNDYVIFTGDKGNKIKYLCPSYIYESMVYGEKYDVTIVDGDFSMPSLKVSKVILTGVLK